MYYFLDDYVKSCVEYLLIWNSCFIFRWAMFGFAVGLLTEFATGSDFVDQVKILLSNFGIVDLE
jgi:hypothetical protein